MSLTQGNMVRFLLKPLSPIGYGGARKERSLPFLVCTVDRVLVGVLQLKLWCWVDMCDGKQGCHRR